MNKLEQLISELCPNGVQYRGLGEFCKISRGIVISKEDIKNDIGEYPVYSSQTENNGQLGKISTYAFDGEYLTWTTDGANAGTVFYRNGKFSVTNVCGLIEISDSSFVIKYVYYYLNLVAPNYVNRGMGNPKLMSNVMAKITVPLPPLPVQEEIVRILDNFTKLTTELTTELTARKKQYEYYKNELFSVDSSVEMLTINDIIIKSYSGATPLANKDEYYNNGNIPWLRTQEVRFVDILDTEIKITESALKNTTVKWIPKNCVIVAISGATAGRSAVNKIPLTTNQHCLCLEVNSQKALYQYVFYWISSQYETLKGLGQGARGDLNSGIIKTQKIPIPSIPEQQRIVDILDRFDILCNDISSGLPAEIKARQQQYEYYRDKLLTFPKANV